MVLFAAQLVVADQRFPKLHPQQAPLWCWAASGQMILELLDREGDYSQATQAEKVISYCEDPPRKTCGVSEPEFVGCDVGGFPAFERLGFEAEGDECNAENTLCALDWHVLKAELDSCRPLAFGWCSKHRCGEEVANSSGHWMVAVAASICERPDNQPVPFVKVFNPAPCCRGQTVWIPYSVYVHGTSSMNFWKNYYQIRPEDEAPPSDTSTTCQLSELTVAAPLANFMISEKNQVGLVNQVLQSCLRSPAEWERSGLSEWLSSPPDTEGGLRSKAPVRRYLLPHDELPETTVEFSSQGFSARRPLYVHPVVLGQRPVGSVVVEETDTGGFQLVAIEDAPTAADLEARRTKASHEAFEVVVVDTGTPFLVDGEDVVVTTSIKDCVAKSPGAEQLDVRRMSYEALASELRARAMNAQPPED